METKISMAPNVEWVSSRAAVMDVLDERSPGVVRACAKGEMALILALVCTRVDSVLPTSVMRGAPALANERAMDYPIPEPPPVMRTVLLAAERKGRVGEMAG